VYNALSPNTDEENSYFRIDNLETVEPNNTVIIYNRWGTNVFEVDNYSEANAFRGLNKNGNELPSGTYFYKIVFKSSGTARTGYLVLKR
jgi:gliding motility-associated-like protein